MDEKINDAENMLKTMKETIERERAILKTARDDFARDSPSVAHRGFTYEPLIRDLENMNERITEEFQKPIVLMLQRFNRDV